MNPERVAELVRARNPDTIVARGEVTATVARDDLIGSLIWLREEPELSFDFLSSLTATDWPGKDPRFWVAYELRSVDQNHRLRVKVGLAEDDAHLPTVTSSFPTADWHERETYDFYGIVFDGHPDLTRILMPEGWDGYPLQKTEELGGVNTRFRGAFIPPVDTRTTT